MKASIDKFLVPHCLLVPIVSMVNGMIEDEVDLASPLSWKFVCIKNSPSGTPRGPLLLSRARNLWFFRWVNGVDFALLVVTKSLFFATFFIPSLQIHHGRDDGALFGVLGCMDGKISSLDNRE